MRLNHQDTSLASTPKVSTAKKYKIKPIFPWLIVLLMWVGIVVLFANQSWWQWALAPYVGQNQAVLYEQNTLFNLAKNHALIVTSAIALVISVSIPLSIFVTRKSGKAYLPLVSNISTISQTLPPMAVLFLFLPIFGFGNAVSIFALFIYGMMPTIQGALTGLQSVDPLTKDAAKGIGYNSKHLLFKVEIPLAIPAILSGIRTSLILVVATATLAPLVGAESLGSPIIAGFSVNNSTQVLQGSIAVALVAIASDYTMRTLEKSLTRWRQ